MEAADDGRLRPSYEILFGQHVGTEDVYLGMSDKTPSSLHCETAVVKVFLPGESVKDVDLDVIATKICIQSPRFKLALYLPNPVDHKKGSARWDASKQILVISLPVTSLSALR